jgi:hypothetical protein
MTSCEICEPIPEVVVDPKFDTPQIITPYYTMVDKRLVLPNWYRYIKSNFTPYQFFVIRMGMMPYIDPSMDLAINSYRDGDRARFIVEVDDLQEDYLPLTEDDANYYQQLMNEILQTPNHVLIYHIGDQIPGLYTPWVLTVIRFIDFVILGEYDPRWMRDGLYVDLSKVVEYDTVWRTLRTKLEKYLKHLHLLDVRVMENPSEEYRSLYPDLCDPQPYYKI